MFLTVHVASGLVIGKYIPSAIFAFVVGFISHIILDIIPHDSIELEKWKKPEVTKILIILFLIEIPLIAIILIALFGIYGFELTPSIISAIIGSVILDFLWGSYLIFPKFRFMKIFKTINHKSHEIMYKSIFLPWKQWLPIQLSLLIIFLLIYTFI